MGEPRNAPPKIMNNEKMVNEMTERIVLKRHHYWKNNQIIVVYGLVIYCICIYFTLVFIY